MDIIILEFEQFCLINFIQLDFGNVIFPFKILWSAEMDIHVF